MSKAIWRRPGDPGYIDPGGPSTFLGSITLEPGDSYVLTDSAGLQVVRTVDDGEPSVTLRSMADVYSFLGCDLREYGADEPIVV